MYALTQKTLITVRSIAPSRLLARGLVTFLIGVSSAHEAFAAPTPGPLRKVMVTGQALPDPIQHPGVALDLQIPTINDAGQVAFEALWGDDQTQYLSIWSEGHGSLQPVVNAGDPAPGVPGQVLGGFGPITLNNEGRALFRSQTGSSPFPTGIWAETTSGVQLIARASQPAPGAPGLTFADIDVAVEQKVPIAFNAAGQTTFRSYLSDVTQGIWFGTPGQVTMLAREIQPMPGMNGSVWGAFGYPLINSAGDVVFSSQRGSGSSIWSTSTGALAQVAATGDAAPGAAAGVTFKFSSPFPVMTINDLGEVAFGTDIQGPGVTNANNIGIWAQRGGSLSLVVRKGAPAPGLPGVTFAGVGLFPGYFNSSRIAMRATLAGAGVHNNNEESIWVERPGGFAMIAREGSHAPGTPAGVNFGEFSVSNPEPIQNAAGQVAFRALLLNTPIESYGIWATDRNGALQLIARTGDTIEVAPGDVRTISVLYLGAVDVNFRDDPPMNAFNSRGQLTFYAHFTDNSQGIFVSNRVAVPEPSAAVLSISAMLAHVLCSRQRWHRHNGVG